MELTAACKECEIRERVPKGIEHFGEYLDFCKSKKLMHPMDISTLNKCPEGKLHPVAKTQKSFEHFGITEGVNHAK